MTTIADPVIGRWYKDIENDLTFTVVAIEEDNDFIEVQYLNGDIGEYDNESWYNSTIDYIEAPEDWSAPYDDLEPDDLGYTDPDIHDNPDRDDLDFSDYYD
ncbi:DUF6763 family protein [Methylomarinum vadi]|uniref:DUF6763 family protein n=1 Tax=Methylomarinum vadi TaxID=438855 RepID=UPI0004DF1B05|nr:DUF6763 family protein [Methylomarinum vadi]